MSQIQQLGVHELLKAKQQQKQLLLLLLLILFESKNIL